MVRNVSKREKAGGGGPRAGCLRHVSRDLESPHAPHREEFSWEVSRLGNLA